MSGQRSMTLKEVAAMLQASDNTVRRLATKGRLRGWRLGRAWRFEPAEVERFKVANQHRATDPLVTERRRKVTPQRNGGQLKGWNKFAHGT